MANIFIIFPFLIPLILAVRNEVILHKNKLEEYRTPFSQSIPKWNFRPNEIFERVNLYLVRLHEVNEIIMAANDFCKLEKIQLGGIRGSHLSQRLQNVHSEFQALYNTFIIGKSNCLEPSNEQFKCLKRNFLAKITIMERKLSHIFIESLENCNGLESYIKFIEMVGPILQRPMVNCQLSEVVKSFQSEIDAVESLVMEKTEKPKVLYRKYFNCISFALTRKTFFQKKMTHSRSHLPIADTIDKFGMLHRHLDQITQRIKFIEHP